MAEPQSAPDGRPPWVKTVSFLSGLILLGYEAAIPDTPRILMVGVAVALIGLPAADVIDRLFGPRK